MIGEENETREQVYHRQQHSVLSWEKSLRFTGGALKASKCYWYLIDFCWQHGTWRYANTEGTICRIQGDYGRGHDILSSPLSEANKTMGVWQDLTGDNTMQIDELIKNTLQR